MYGVPVVSSTMAWHCTVCSPYCITMHSYYLCRSVVTTELVSLQDEDSARTTVLDVNG